MHSRGRRAKGQGKFFILHFSCFAIKYEFYFTPQKVTPHPSAFPLCSQPLRATYLICSKASVLHRVVVKESIAFIAGHQARTTGSSCSEDPNSQMAFREGFLKTLWGRGVTGCPISLYAILWLFDGEATGWWFRNLDVGLLDPTSLGVYMLMVSLGSACWWSAVSI